MVRGNPIRVVGRGRGNGRAGALLTTLSTLGAGSTLLASLAGLALLREVGSDPNGVEEVYNADEAGQEEEVQEDTGGYNMLAG